MILIIIRNIYMVISILLAITMVFIVVDSIRKNNKYNPVITPIIASGIFSILAYTGFMLSKNHFQAVLFDSLFFIGIDWIAYSMVLFSITYTELKIKNKKHFLIIFITLCTLDSISLLVNNLTYHMFDLILTQGILDFVYWGCVFLWPYYLHLVICYLMVSSCLCFFVISLIKAPVKYKDKYISVLVAYLILIITNMVCYILDLPIDVSVILYGILSILIYLQTGYAFPHKVLNVSLKAVNETISDAIICYDIKGSCIYANKTAHKLFTENGKFSPKKAEEYREKWLETIGIQDETFVVDKENFMVDGEVYHCSLEFQKEFFEGIEVGSCLKLVDKTAETESYMKELYRATHDELTDLYNRIGFFEAVDAYIQENVPEDFIMVSSNIKDFKLINELFGEKLGDEVLKKQAAILKYNSSPDSIFGRISDDRFALYCKKSNFNEEEFKAYIESMHKLTESSIYQMHIFVGVYDPQGRIESAQTMYDKSVMAMSEISHDYTEVFSYYDSTLMEKLLNEKNIIEDFQQAIQKKQIIMVLQPIIDSKNGKFGAEALCRWNHPLRGLLLPVDFLEILEKAGLIYQLDEYIWHLAAQKLQEWNQKGCHDCYISVNVSVKDFFYTDIYKTFTGLVDQYDISPANFHIEITETVLMSDFSKAFSLATKLKKAGFVVAIDNFGTGHSSLNMLKDFEADIIKVDMALLAQASTDERSHIILTAILDMASQLNIPIVGEGVELKDQYDLLVENKCFIHQGNYLSEPLFVEDYEDRFVKYLYNK